MPDGTNPPIALSHVQEHRLDEDAVLVSRSQQGDLDAFEQLVVKHQKRMMNTAFRLVQDYDEACEVAQDAFLSAYRNIKGFRGDAKFTTWLTTITVNLSKNKLKQMRSQQGHVAFSFDAPVMTDEGELTIDPPSKEPSVLDRMEKRDIQARVQDCIKALEPDFREVLVLRDMQEFSYEEVGAMLTLAAGTVKSRLFRAREAIKDCLKKAMGEL